MGKYISIIIGAIVALLGLIGLLGWWCDFVIVLKGSIPAMFIFGGVIAVIAGLSELKDKQSAGKNENK